jgi:VWFA-related protein
VFRTTTRIVLLDIVVTDKKGQVVTNLKQGDFSIYDDGSPQRIRSFEAPIEHRMPPATGIVVRSTADLAKIGSAPVTILVLDELNTSFEDMAYSRNRLEKYLLAQPEVMTQPTELLVATNTKFNVIKDFTQDRAEVLAALKKHYPEIPYKFNRSGAGGPGAMERMSQSLNSLYEMAQSTRGTPGRKTIIWVGKGFPAVDLTKTDAATEDLMQSAIRRLTDSLLQSRITLYTIDPADQISSVGQIATADNLEDFENDARSDGQPFKDQISFSTLAPATGGQAFFSRNDIDAEVAQATADGANYYTLSYSPTALPDGKDKYRKIRVKMSDPNLTATFRDGYYSAPPPTGASKTGEAPKTKEEVRTELEAEMGKAAMGSVAYNGVNATIEKTPDGKVKLGVTAGDLTFTDENNGKFRAEITVIEVAFNKGGKPLAHHSQELSAEVMGQIKNPNQKAGFLIPLDAPPNTTRIRVVVRDAVSGKIGTAEMAP